MSEGIRARRSRRWERGQALAEFALVMPIVTLVIFGLVDLSRAMQSYVTIQEAARSAARYAVTGRTDCTGVQTQTRMNCIAQEVAVRTASLNNAASITSSVESWARTTPSGQEASSSSRQRCRPVTKCGVT